LLRCFPQVDAGSDAIHSLSTATPSSSGSSVPSGGMRMVGSVLAMRHVITLWSGAPGTMCRTVVNVTSDLAAAVVVARGEPCDAT